MNSFRNLLIIPVLGIILIQCQSSKSPLSERNADFNKEWHFFEDLSGQVAAERTDFDDSGWRLVDLPHDWSVEDYPVRDQDHEGPFVKNLPGARDAGFLRGGTGWYRKQFILEPEDAGKTIYIHFDGVQSEMTLWVNGQEAGKHVYGYTPFYFDITSLLNAPGEENILAVKVDKPEENSRWYTGAGIYRPVALSVVNPVHIDVWGVSVVVQSAGQEKAVIGLVADVVNNHEQPATISIQARIISPEGKPAAEDNKEITVPPDNSSGIPFTLEVDHPELWDTEDPDLYTAVITISQKNKSLDRLEQPFGIRTISFSAEEGFMLNGKPVLLKGGCLHHDNGLLGAAAFRRAEYRRVELLKSQGFNAVRCAHNPPSKLFLDACDELGMLVIDESFDMWHKPKRPNDYHRHYKEWWRKDTEAMLLRDRNHPCIIMWSIGNEVQERADSSGLAIAKAAYDFIKSNDITRPVTQAICGFWDNPGLVWEDTEPAFARMDVGGYNYQWAKYEADHGKFPDRIMFGSESVPKEAFENWELVEKHPYVTGDFVWTCMDYIGEAGIGKSDYKKDKDAQLSFHSDWPWYNAWCGDIDLTGNKKPQSFYRDVVWGESNLEMLVHEPVPAGMHEVISFWGWPEEFKSWNWQGNEGIPLVVSVYSSYPEVRLELNGELIGTSKITSGDRLTATFEVPYEKGELKASGIQNGEVIEFQTLKTTGPATEFQLSAERDEIAACRGEIAYIKVTALDTEGNPVPDSFTPATVEISGPAGLLAAGNASPFAEGSIRNNNFSLHRGRGLIIIRSTGEPGTIEVKVSAEGLETGQTEITAKQELQ